MAIPEGSYLNLANPNILRQFNLIAEKMKSNFEVKKLKLVKNISYYNDLLDKITFAELFSVHSTWFEKYKDSLDESSLNQLISNPLRILDSKNPKIKNLLKDAPMIESSLSIDSRNRFLKLQDLLQSLSIPFHVNKSLVRGLDYYCHSAFEITSTQLGAQATVCGGGRYDGLVEQLGGPSTTSL